MYSRNSTRSSRYSTYNVYAFYAYMMSLIHVIEFAYSGVNILIKRFDIRYLDNICLFILIAVNDFNKKEFQIIS